MTQPFIHLRCRSAYSLLKGAMTVKSLAGYAKAQNFPALAITDQDNLFGSLEFSETMMKEGVQPITGMLVSIVPQGHPENTPLKADQADQLLLIAKDQAGYSNLLALSSKGYVSPELGQAPLVSYQDVLSKSEGVICLTAGIFGGIGKALLNGRKEASEILLAQFKEAFGDRLYVELMRHGLQEEQRIEEALIELAMRHELPLVASNDIYFSDAEMYEAHDALMCISDGRYVTETDRPKLTPQHRLKSADEMRELFADIPEAIANTSVIAQRCCVISPSRAPILPGFLVEDDEGNVLSETEALRKLARDGLENRLEKFVFTQEMDDTKREKIATPYRERLEYELDVIITMKFPGYFLIVSDFIKWSKEQGIPVGPGRGSGAGSVVAWALLITDLDPLEFGLIFERFLNPERVSMPDFDIDFCQERRDEVIRYVQEKYGHDRVAQIITFGKLQARAVLRDVGRVLQMPYGQVDRICKLVPANPANPCTLPEALEMEPQIKHAMEEDETAKKLVELSIKLEGLYRHASTHAAGVVIGDRPLEELVPLYRDPKSDMSVVQYSMKYAEGAGLVKFDFLGLKTLSVIKQAVTFINERVAKNFLVSLPPCGGVEEAKADSVGGNQNTAGQRIASGATQAAQQNAKTLRKNMTEEEHILWAQLKEQQLGYKFRKQQPIGNYIADFYQAETRLIVEVDGGQHNNNDKNVERTAWLKSQGLHVMRFWNNEVRENLAGVVQTIQDYLDSPHQHREGDVDSPAGGELKPQSKYAQPLDIETIPFDDPASYAMLSKGQTVGVFQFESAGMQDAIKKLKPDCIDDLIALGALYRPGPMDNIPTYIARKHGREKPDYLHEMLTEVLRETYGVIIYQEQVQKIAQVMAGYTLGGADLLRRAMGKKIKAEMDAQREMFVKGAEENGVPKKQSSSIFDLVAKFAGYGFNKSHAAAYAVIAYQTAYLKANYPVEFMAASMNYDLQNTDKLAIFAQEAKAMGIEMLPPDVNRSQSLFSVEETDDSPPTKSASADLTPPQGGSGKRLAVRYGLAAIKNVGSAAMDGIVAERTENGDYSSIADFAKRIDAQHMNRRQLEHLISAGAFDSLHDNRRQLYESADMLLAITAQASKDRESNQVSLFDAAPAGDAPEAELQLKPVDEWENVERLNYEQLAIGFYLTDHPLAGYQPLLENLKVTQAADLERKLPSEYTSVSVAGVVVDKKVKRSARGKFAFLLLSDVSGIADISIFDEEMLNDPDGLLEKGQMLVVRAEGKSGDGGMRVIAKSIQRLDDASAGAMPRSLEIEVKDKAALEEVIAMCGQKAEQGQRGTKLTLKMPAGSGHVATIELPDKYVLTPDAVAKVAA